MSSQVLQILINGQDRTQEVFRGLQTNVKGLKGKLDELGQSMQRVGANLTAGLTVPLAAMAGGAARAAISFETAFAGVRKTVDATEAQFKKLNDGFREMAKTIPISAVELAKIGEAAGQLGIRQESVLGFTKVMAQLGVTTNLSAEEAASSLAQLANITGMSHDAFDRLGAAVVALGNDGASTEKQIVEMGLRIAGAGHQVGLAEHQILAVGAALANVGIEAEAGGTAISRTLKEMQIAISRGGESLQQFAQVAGVSAERFRQMFADDAAAALNAFIAGLNEMKLQGTDVISVLDAMGITEMRQSDALLRLAGNADQLTKALKVGAEGWRANTALTKEATERFKTTESQLVLLWNRVKDVGITLGNALLPHIQATGRSLEGLIPKIDSAAKWFASLEPWVQKTAIALLGLAGLAGPTLYLFGQLAGAVTNLTALFKALTALQVASWFVALGNTVPVLTARVWLLEAGFLAVAAAAAKVLAVGLGAYFGTQFVMEVTGARAALDGLIDKWTGLTKATNDAAAANRRAMDSSHGPSAGARDPGLIKEWYSKLTHAQRVAFDEQLAEQRRFAAEQQRLNEAERQALAGHGAQVVAHIRTRRVKTKEELEAEQKALKEHNERIRELMDRVSGAAAQRSMNDLAEAVRRLGGAIPASQVQALTDEIARLQREGAKIPPVLQLLFAQGLGNQAIEAARESARRHMAGLSADLEVFRKNNEKLIADEERRRAAEHAAWVEWHDELQSRLAAQELLMEQWRTAISIANQLADAIGGIVGALAGADSVLARFTSSLTNALQTAQRGASGDIGGAISSALTGAFSGGQESGRAGGSRTEAGVRGFISGSAVGSALALLGHSRGIAQAAKEGARAYKDMHAEIVRAHGSMENMLRTARNLGVSTTGVNTSDPAQIQALQAQIDRAQQQQQQRMEGINRAIQGLGAYTAGFIAQLRRGGPVTDSMRDSFRRLGDYAAAAFGALIRETGNIISALRQMRETLNQLREAMTRFGLEGSAALLELMRLHDFAEANDDLMQQIEGLTELMRGLAQAGVGTAEIFHGFGLDAVRIFREMTEGRGLDSRTAMILMQGILQTLWERMRDFGDITDEATLALLRQAETDGIVGENMRSVHERILTVLIAIARVLNADLPAGFDRTARAAEESAERARRAWERARQEMERASSNPFPRRKPGPHRPDDDDDDDDDWTPPPAAHGMRVPWTPGGRGILVGEAATENILSDEQVAAIVARSMAMAGGSLPGRSSGGAAQPVIVQIDGRTLLSFVIPAVAEASGDGRLRTSRRSTVTRIS